MMVWCTYCGQEFSRAEHLDRHVLTHTNIKPYKCSTCHFSFKRRDLLRRHFLVMHREREDSMSNADGGDSHRQPIACRTCAKAKTKCDKLIPTCGRCQTKGLICEARTPKRSTDAAYRLARQQLNPYRKPITIAPFPYSPSSQTSTQYGYSEPLSSSPPIGIHQQFMSSYTGYDTTDSYSRPTNQYSLDVKPTYEPPSLVDAFALPQSPRHVPVTQSQSSTRPSSSPCYTPTPSAIPAVAVLSQEQAMSSTPTGWTDAFSTQAAFAAQHLVASTPTVTAVGVSETNYAQYYSEPAPYELSPELLMRSPSSTRSSTELSSDLSITSGDVQPPFTTGYEQQYTDPADYYLMYDRPTW